MRKRFVAVAAALNLMAIVIVGLLPKGADANDLVPYAAALNFLVLVSGIGIAVARREVHGARGIACDLALFVLVPILFFAILAGVIPLLRPDVR